MWVSTKVNSYLLLKAWEAPSECQDMPDTKAGFAKPCHVYQQRKTHEKHHLQKATEKNFQVTATGLKN